MTNRIYKLLALCLMSMTMGAEAEAASPALERSETTTLDCAYNLYSRPGVRYMHKLRAKNPSATLSVSGLPKGLTWNNRRNLVEGMLSEQGIYTYNVIVSVDGSDVIEPVTLTVTDNLEQPVPLMGWLSWNVFGPAMDEQIIRETADAMVDNGLVAAGYNYLCLDDLWQAPGRDSVTGKPLSDVTKFPGGFKALADYVHTKGLKFGIYSDAAEQTCGGAYASYRYEDVDARQYADWGFDLLKYDYCGAPDDRASAFERYKAMGDALKASGRDILFYMCEWGGRQPWQWADAVGATCWRCTGDTRDCWIGENGGIGVIQSIEGMKSLWPYSGVNRFNDADMMCVGLHGTGRSSNDLCKTGPGMTDDEYRTQFSLWCMWSSPLTLSFDVRHISPKDLALITNSEVIALDQDPMGQQAELIRDNDGVQIYAKDLADGTVAVALVNLNDEPRDIAFDFAEIPALEAGKTYTFRDLWSHADIPAVSNRYSVSVAPHATELYRLR